MKFISNIKLALITEGILLSVIILFNKWFGKELFDFYIFSLVICKIFGYASIILYPFIKFKSKIYEIKIAGEEYEIFYSFSVLILFIIQIVLILFKIKFPIFFTFITSFYEIYNTFLKRNQ